MARYEKKIKDIDIRIDKRSNYKNINIKVTNKGEVRVSAPRNATDKYIEDLILDNIDKIRVIQKKYIDNYENNKLKYIDGEIVKLWGDDYLLKIQKSNKDKVYIKNDQIIIEIKNLCSTEYKEKLLETFYKKELLAKLDLLIDKYSKKMDVKVNGYKVRKMKSRWGSININKKIITFNLELAKIKESSTELVVVHELSHLFEKGHNKRFYKIVESFYPDYKIDDEYLKNYEISY